METNILKQMTLKTLGCDGKDAIRQNKQVFMARIGGEVQNVKTKEKKNGDPYSYFIGNFVALRGEQRYESETLFLPGFLFEKIEAQFKSGGEKPVVFGYDLFAQLSEKSSVGYAYVAQNVIHTETADRIKEICNQWSDKPLPGMEQPAPAPVEQPTPEPDKQPADKKKRAA